MNIWYLAGRLPAVPRPRTTRPTTPCALRSVQPRGPSPSQRAVQVHRGLCRGCRRYLGGWVARPSGRWVFRGGVSVLGSRFAASHVWTSIDIRFLGRARAIPGPTTAKHPSASCRGSRGASRRCHWLFLDVMRPPRSKPDAPGPPLLSAPPILRSDPVNCKVDPDARHSVSRVQSFDLAGSQLLG